MAVPSATIEVVYCDKCGRDNLHYSLKDRHFTKGALCVGGTLKRVIYRRDNSTIRKATQR